MEIEHPVKNKRVNVIKTVMSMSKVCQKIINFFS